MTEPNEGQAAHRLLPLRPGGVLNLKHAARGFWGDELRPLHITHLELEAVYKMVQSFLRQLMGKDTTLGNYRPKAAAFMQFCVAEGRSWLPATKATVRLYLAHLMSKGTIKAASLQPYLSAINNYHEDMGFDGPAKGRSVSREVKGMASCRAEMELLRVCTYVVFAFVTFGRPDTGVSRQKSHIAVADDVISVVLHKEKGRRHVRLKRRLTIPAAGVEGLVQLLEHWEGARDSWWQQTSSPCGEAEGDSYWRLPWEQRRLTSAQADDWVQLALGVLKCLPLEGGHFSGHTGACTCARAVGALLEKCCLLGGWSQLSSAIHAYNNPTVVPDEHMERYMSATGLTGSIATELGKLTSIKYMHIGHNGLTGAIPSQLSTMIDLKWWTFANNKLTAPIPTWISALSKLTFTDLSYNSITGTIPTDLGALTQMEELKLQNNCLTGSLPTELASLTSLANLYVQSNTALCGSWTVASSTTVYPSGATV
ncbi:hypothetical protein CYMTET_41579 [Cymbomonas tetramitiformis]|uniref:Core-binding (CB) domain-containing protein n=1 Tax=Cymbomonas tetramitiformis TaxID=36881 RepID=A0AAE0C5T3_9CHLO|nr:hypothetical protein CYMTET_41579 [Cymbomonas tetramitiformis]